MKTYKVLDREVKIKFSNVYAVGTELHEAIIVLEDDTELRIQGFTPEQALEDIEEVLYNHIKATIAREKEDLRQKLENEFYDKLWEFVKENYELYLGGLKHGRSSCIDGEANNQGRCSKCNLVALGRQLDWIGRDEFRMSFDLQAD